MKPKGTYIHRILQIKSKLCKSNMHVYIYIYNPFLLVRFDFWVKDLATADLKFRFFTDFEYRP